MSKISVLGCGGWGTALSMLCADNDHEVVLWGKFADEVNTLKATRTTRLLEGVTVPSSIKITDNINDIKNFRGILYLRDDFSHLRSRAFRPHQVHGKAFFSAIIITFSF